MEVLINEDYGMGLSQGLRVGSDFLYGFSRSESAMLGVLTGSLDVCVLCNCSMEQRLSIRGLCYALVL